MKDYEELVFLLLVVLIMFGGLWLIPADGLQADKNEDIHFTQLVNGVPITF